MDEKQRRFFNMMIALAIVITIIVTLLVVNLGVPTQEKIGSNSPTVVVAQKQTNNKAIVTAVVKDEEVNKT